MFAVTRLSFAARKAAAPKRAVRRLTSFGLFMKQTAKNPALNALPIKKRGVALGKMWRALPATQKKALAAQAKKIVLKPKVRKARKARKPSAYNKFIQANYRKVKNVAPKKRLAALAKMWKAAKKN
uniref:HMG box domain-containing protein n=1 Tax=Neobodo designis TaxID=312471 RepID=A0A7S1PR78_NEODS|mmetsp:Transcript_16607/g.51492  ORF Transcript_16607/g.51492 Transcript_16607/m.51492 type:complete len:126 (+) Transcript_16607:41-418(+)